MTGALLILLFLIVMGLGLWLYDVFFWKPRHSGSQESEVGSGESEVGSGESEEGDPGICCGMHAVCEKTSLTPLGNEDAVYYDDEELDRFRGREAGSYTPDESEEFRDVMLTMRPEEVAGWSRSLQARRIELPGDVREELLMIVGELRAAGQKHGSES